MAARVVFDLLLFNFPMPILVPMAHATVVETLIAKYGVEILATILVGSGIGFASSDGARATAAGCWDWMEMNATSAWNTIKAWSIKALENPGIVSNSGVRMTTSLWNAIEGAVSSFRLVDGTFVSLLSCKISDLPSVDDYKSSGVLYKQLFYRDGIWNASVDEKSDHKNEIYRLFYRDGQFSYGYFTAWDTRISDIGLYGLTSSLSSDGTYNISVCYGAKMQRSDGTIYNQVNTSSYGYGSADDIVKFGLGDAVAIPSTGDLVYPSDNYLVKMPDIPDVHLEEDG